LTADATIARRFVGRLAFLGGLFVRTLVLASSIALVSSLPVLAQPPPAPNPPGPCVPAGDTDYVCNQRAPEDLVVVPGGQWVVASAYAGAGGLELVRVADKSSMKAYPAPTARNRPDAKAYPNCPTPPEADKFTTHGLSLEAGRRSVHRLFVVGHGAREAIEVFEIDARPATPTVTWIGCVVAPEPIGLNSVRGLPDGGFVTTNFLPRGGDRAATQRMQAGEKNGELWEWHVKTGWQKVPGSEAAGANGVELSPDGKTLYMALWGSQSFVRLSRGATPPKRDEVPLGFRVDNVHWARDGSLVAVGQGTGGDAQNWIAVKIDPKTLAVREVMKRANNDAFGNGTVAAELGDRWWIGSFRGDKIAIVPAP
jgi:hypothetical protein